MKLDFKVCHLPNDTLQLCLSIRPSVRLSFSVSVFLRNEMRNLSRQFVFSCGSSALRLFVAADPHPARYTSPQLNTPPPPSALHPPIHLSGLLVRGPGVPFITSSSITGGISQLYATKHPRCLPTFGWLNPFTFPACLSPSCQCCRADVASRCRVWRH